MKRNQPGYIIPDNPSPEGYICLKVFIPDAIEYLYAFSGAFTFFGKWNAWQRGPEHKATLAAAAWREAIQKTFDEAWLDCGEENEVCEHCDLIPEILAQLQELTNMNINVNCGCGCSGAGSGSPTPAPPTAEDYPPNPVPPVVPPGDDAGQAWLCNMAHYNAFLWRKWAMYAADLQLTNIMQDAENVYLNLGLAPQSYATRLAYASTAILLLGGTTSAIVAADYTPNFDAVVCAIYGAPTAAAALDNLREISRQLFGAHGPGMDWILLLMPLEAAFTPQSPPTNLPPAYRTKTCELCSDAEVDWGNHVGYVWQPLTNALLDAFTFTPNDPGGGNASTHVLTDDGHINWSYTDAASANMLWRALSADVVAAVPGGIRIAGIGWDFYSSNEDTGSPYWYETMNTDAGAALDATVNTIFPKKWWVWLENLDDTDINDLLSEIADFNGSTPEDSEIFSNGEIQSGVGRFRNGECRVRFLVAVP